MNLWPRLITAALSQLSYIPIIYGLSAYRAINF
ncbi:MAG: hypothetical protein H6Q43_1478, partial [Deltaproteobacteria bacterium]|nr:hypothetical protein [Deltaproteobacteria bacterium]